MDGTSGTVGGVDENGNPLEEEDLGGISMNSPFGVFARCIMRSPSLLRVDIRQTGLPPELAERITTTVKHRELRAKGIPVEAYEKSKEVHDDTVGEEVVDDPDADAGEV